MVVGVWSETHSQNAFVEVLLLLIFENDSGLFWELKNIFFSSFYFTGFIYIICIKSNYNASFQISLILKFLLSFKKNKCYVNF